MKVLKPVMNVLAALEKFCMCFIGMASTLLVVANVIVRKFIPTVQLAWTEELVVNFFILLIMCGVALGAREGSLISLSLVYDLVGKKAKGIFNIIISVVNIIFYSIVLNFGIEKVAKLIANNKRTSILLWPEWVFWLFIPIGFGLCILHTVEFYLSTLENKDEGGQKA